MKTSRRRGFTGVKITGFTLVELLVVITIIGMLAGMLMPAISAARESARMAQCQSQQKNLGSAVQQYEGLQRQFPGYLQRIGPSYGFQIEASWIVALLPYLDRSDLYNVWQTGTGPLPQGAAVTDRLRLWKFLTCPSAPPLLSGPSDTPLGYVCNAGMRNYPGSYAPYAATHTGIGAPEAYGVFTYHGLQVVNGSKVPLDLGKATLEFVSSHDGASMTLMLAENNLDVENTAYLGWAQANSTVNQTTINTSANTWQYVGRTTGSVVFPNSGFDGQEVLSFVWDPSAYQNPPATWGAGVVINNKINADRRKTYTHPSYAVVSAWHRNGAVGTYCDGHQQFLRDDMDQQIFCQLCTPYGAGAWNNSYSLLKSSNGGMTKSVSDSDL